MKVLQINTSLNSSSTGKITHQISKIITENRGDSYIAFSGRYNINKDIKESFRIGSKLDFYWHALMTRIFDRHGFGSIGSTKKLVKKIESIQPDIIHLHNIHGYYINIEVLFNYLSLLKTPIIWTMHDCWAFTGHCTHFEFVGCSKWKNECHNCPQKSSYPASLIKDNSKENFLNKKRLFNSPSKMTIVPVSSWLQNQLNYSFLKSYDSKVIHNGIDLEVFKFSESKEFIKEHKLQNKFIVLGVASVWTQRKGFYEFIKLSSKLNKDFAIVLVGVDYKLQKKLPKNIISIKKTSNQAKLADIYSSANLYLNLTFEDTFPSTNLESIACGTPVVTYKTGGSSETIEKSGGIVINQGDMGTLIKTLEKIKNKSLIMASKTDLRIFAEKNFNKDNNFDKYIKLYRSVLKAS
jgi:putative colanic acid biosynthesis glycosyltransferase